MELERTLEVRFRIVACSDESRAAVCARERPRLPFRRRRGEVLLRERGGLIGLAEPEPALDELRRRREVDVRERRLDEARRLTVEMLGRRRCVAKAELELTERGPRPDLVRRQVELGTQIRDSRLRWLCSAPPAQAAPAAAPDR